MKNNLHFVYILQSKVQTNEFYTGYTIEIGERLKEHNLGLSKHTAKFKPWKIISYCVFQEKKKAIEFEKYLKSGSGRAFTEKHLISK